MLSSRVVRRVGGVVGCFGAVSALVIALLHPGVVSTEVDLNDGGVWVTNSKSRLVGHLNYPARLLDSGFRASSSVFNVHQNGEQVIYSDVEGATLAPVDVASALLGAPVPYEGLVTSVNGGKVAVAEAASGKVWIQDQSLLSPIALEETVPSIEDMPGVQAVVGVDGGVHAVSTEAQKIISVVPRGATQDRIERTLDAAFTPESTLQISSVGEIPVVFDKSQATLYFGNGQQVQLSGEGLTLQEPGPAADTVLLASDSALLEVPIGGGEALTYPTSAPGHASRPVRHLGCIYGAWSVSGAFIRQCPGDTDDVEMTVDTIKTAEQAVFRTNRDVIVLNDTENGGLWLPDQNMLLVDNWDQIESTIESEDESDEDSPDETEQTLLPERSEKNTPPEAQDDKFGVRAGRVNILPVVSNDSDIDGDFLTVAPVTQPSLGTVSVARDASALQINVNAGATGSASFEYEVSDGRGGTAKARVFLDVHGDDINSAPEQHVVPHVTLGSGRRATVNAISDWVDPDGDPFYLESATAPAGLSVRTHVNGSVDLADVGHGPGKDAVTLRVSDGRDIGEGTLSVTVKDSGNEPPVANADHVVVRVGSSAVVSPLLNDTDPNGDVLRLVQIESAPVGLTAMMDGTNGTISLEGAKPGTYYLGYVVTDGPATGSGVIRVDVVDGSVEAPPSPEPDLGVLPEGGQVLIDLLANDSDPTGGVLTVQKIDVASASSLVVALVNHQMVRVSAPRGLNSPETFTYTVSNGVAEATASVTVLPREAHSGGEPPELSDDQIVVRTGDVASVAVLANDRSPSGLKMTVSNDLQHEIKADLGEVFISDNIVRVRGGSRAGSGKIVYTVHDTAGNVASAVVNVVVVAMDEATNTPPRPKDVTVRTVAGGTVPVIIPLDNIDPEGDSVSVVGLGSAPQLGTVVQEGNILRYTAANTAKGTDSFTYVVQDRLGKQATAKVRVGVAPQASTNQKPLALPDQVQVRPGARVAVAVLSNDIDPDGDTLVLDKDSLSSQTPGLEVSERSGRIVVIAPKEEGSHVISYGIHDSRGGTASGILTIVVKAQAPLLAPIARDDAVTDEMMALASNNSVVVPVLENDEDPDGDIQDVQISSPDAGVKVNSDKTVTVTLSEQEQILIYTLTDTDGKVASAIIRVPGTVITRPSLDSSTVPIRVKAGVATEIRVNDHIKARDGRKVLITSEQNVSAGIGHDGSKLVKDSVTLSFRANEDFSGPTSITLEVTDGKDYNDPDGVSAIVTLPVEVEPADNRPPTFTPTGLEIAPGEEAVTANLSQAVTDPDKDDPTSMTYRIVGQPSAGINASISGTVLSVSAAADASKGPAGVVRVSVDDGRGGTAEADVPITIVASSRPLIQTSEAQVTLDAGKSTTVDVTQYVTNPFADQGPITLHPSPTATEGGSATASGTSITVAANAGFNGTFTVTYTVGDVTKDPTREVRGSIIATVRDKPGAPTNTTVVSNSSGTAQISWTAGPANGSPITTFTVTDHTQGDSMECGLVTTCLFSGRTNGIEHTFSVTATNEVGVSEASNQATTMIDIEPEAPGAPTLHPGDREITVSWTPPHNEGSALIDYEVTLSPAGTQTIPAGQTSTTFTGLVNGAEYVATVKARNGKGSSPLSQPSPAVVPYGAPGPVSGLQATPAGVGKNTVTITWTPPANTNGRPIEYYTIVGGGIERVVKAPAQSATFENIPFSNSQIPFSVTATNDGKNAANRTSPEITAFVWVVGQPPVPLAGSIRANGNNGEIILEGFAPQAGSGWGSGDLTYQWNAGAGWASLPGNGVLSGNGLANGQTTSIQIRAVGDKTGTALYSETVTTNSTSPFGPPSVGNMICSPTAYGQIECSWDGVDTNGRSGQVVLSGHVNKTLGAANGKETFSVSEGARVDLCVTLVQSSSELGERSTKQVCGGATHPTYSRQYSTSEGTAVPPTGPCKANCRNLKLSLSNWPPNSYVRCTGILQDPRYTTPAYRGTYTTTIQVSSDGSWSGEALWSHNGGQGRVIRGNTQQGPFSTYFDEYSCAQQ